MSDCSNSTCDDSVSSCGSECGSECGSQFEGEVIPFTFYATDKEPLEFEEEGMAMRLDSLTLLSGKDCVVYQETESFGRICLGRLIHPYTTNLVIHMEEFAEEMKVVVESNGEACKVAISGVFEEEFPASDDESMMSDGASDEEEHGVSIEEIASPDAAALVDEEASESNSDSASSSEEEDIEEAKPVEKAPEPKKDKKEKKQDVSVVKSPAKKEASPKKASTPAKPVSKSESATEQKQEQKSEPKSEQKTEQKSTPKKQEAVAAKPVNEEGKTGIKKNLGRGLSYEVLNVGRGAMAVQGKNVSAKYTVCLARNGQKVDSGIIKFRLGAGEVVQGFDKGVKGMFVNEKRRIFVPSALGYGKKKTGNIPPNSDLVFEVTLQSVQ